MLCHAVLVLCEPLFCCHLEIELKVYSLVVPSFVMVIYLIACESDLGWDGNFISVC